MPTVSVAAPLCAPAPAHVRKVRQQLAPYEFKLGGIDARPMIEGGKAVAMQIDVQFSDEAAEWGEYVLLRYGYQRLGTFINPKNEGWAARYTVGSGAWYEESCKDKPKPKPDGAPYHMPATLRSEGSGSAHPPRPWSANPRPPRGQRASRARTSPERTSWLARLGRFFEAEPGSRRRK